MSFESDGQGISTIEWQGLKNEFRLFSDYKKLLRTEEFNVFIFLPERFNSEKTEKNEFDPRRSRKVPQASVKLIFYTDFWSSRKNDSKDHDTEF